MPLLEFAETKDGRQAAAFTVTSPRARAMRLALVAARMPEGAEVRIFGNKYGHQVYGPYVTGDLKRKKPGRSFWTPVIEGEAVGVEIVLPRGADPRGVDLAVTQVSHMVHSVLDPISKNLSHIGNSGSCNIDAACRGYERRHTAKYIYTDANGVSWLCSGTMMNDGDSDSWIPFFLTAEHCVDTQDEADTVNSYWDFERATAAAPIRPR